MSIIRKAFFGNTANRKPVIVDYNRLLQNQNAVFYNFDVEDFLERGYINNAEVYKILRKIIDKCAIADPILYEDDGDVKSKYRKYKKAKYNPNAIEHVKKKLYTAKVLDYVEEENELTKLLRQPNETQSWREMIEMFRIIYFNNGESCLIRETEENSEIAISLSVAPASKMTFIVEDDKISKWKYDMNNGRVRILDASDVFYMKMAHPRFDGKHSELRGMSPLTPGGKYLTLDDESIEAWVKTMQNEGAKGILSPNHNNIEQWLTPEQQKQTEKAVDNKIHGAKNKNRVVVSAMPLQYTQIGMTPDNLNIKSGLSTAEEKLCDLWGVPPVLFNPEPTYANQNYASKRFVADVILPYLNKEEDALNRWLVEPFSKRDGRKYVIDYDTSLFPELKVSLDERTSLEKILTVNEMRVLEGYDEIESEMGNMVFINSGLVPIDDFSGDFRDTFN